MGSAAAQKRSLFAGGPNIQQDRLLSVEKISAMRNYDTLLDALNDLKSRGYTFDFKLQFDCLECAETGKLDPNQFEITEVYRFEGMTNPDDSAVLYAIEGKQGEKGTLVDAYGAYASPLSADMIEKLRITH